MIKKNKTVTLKYGVYDIMYENGRKETSPMTIQQLKGLKRSKEWKRIIACDCICKLEVGIKIKF